MKVNDVLDTLYNECRACRDDKEYSIQPDAATCEKCMINKACVMLEGMEH